MSGCSSPLELHDRVLDREKEKEKEKDREKEKEKDKEKEKEKDEKEKEKILIEELRTPSQDKDIAVP